MWKSAKTVISYQLSVISYQLSVISAKKTAIFYLITLTKNSNQFGRNIYITFWAHAMRPYHWRNNIIVGANCIRPLLITFTAHLYVRESQRKD
jgi:hypothetical protein